MPTVNRTKQSRARETQVETLWLAGAFVSYSEGWSVNSLNRNIRPNIAESKAKLAVSRSSTWIKHQVSLALHTLQDLPASLLFDQDPNAALAVFYISDIAKQPPKNELGRLTESVADLLAENISPQGYLGPRIVGNLATCLVPSDQWEKQELDLPALFSLVQEQAKGTLWQSLVVPDLDPSVWHYRGMDQLPDHTVIKDGLAAVLKLTDLPALSDAERAGIRALWELWHGVLEGDLAIVANSRASVRSLVDKVKDMSPEEFFAWFDLEHARVPQRKLQAVVKAWVALQVGKHGFQELAASEAVAKKHVIALGVQDILDRAGLAIVCQHVYRDTKQVCGQVGRLNAKLRGSSVHGQFLILHNTRATGNVKHSSSTTFPHLTLG